jgi:hypothetical protein
MMMILRNLPFLMYENDRKVTGQRLGYNSRVRLLRKTNIGRKQGSRDISDPVLATCTMIDHWADNRYA